jgi:hypothetical protein
MVQKTGVVHGTAARVGARKAARNPALSRAGSGVAEPSSAGIQAAHPSEFDSAQITQQLRTVAFAAPALRQVDFLTPLVGKVAKACGSDDSALPNPASPNINRASNRNKSRVERDASPRKQRAATISTRHFCELPFPNFPSYRHAKSHGQPHCLSLSNRQTRRIEFLLNHCKETPAAPSNRQKPPHASSASPVDAGRSSPYSGSFSFPGISSC